jgi:hypothetical protein
VVQVDPDPGLYTPAWGGDPEPIPHCAGRQRISITGTGWGSLAWSSDVNVALYSPCGVQGTFAKVWKGHIYTHNDHVTTDILANLECSPMEITGVVGLPCDINDVTSSGSMNINAWRLGDRVSQTEP